MLEIIENLKNLCDKIVADIESEKRYRAEMKNFWRDVDLNRQNFELPY